MRSALAGPFTPLLGSLGLHGSVVLALWLSLHRPVRTPSTFIERPDAWLGNAVEVDAVATPDSAANVPSSVANASPALAEPAEPDVARPVTTPAVATGTVAPAVPKSDADQGAAPARPRPARVAKPASTKSAGAPATPESGSGAASPAAGAFGAQGLPPGVRSLPSAFTRAIPPATGADPIWQTLPVGNERPFTIQIAVDADGHVGSAEIVREKAGGEPATQALHLRDRVLALLGAGTFALQNNPGAGRELLRITITLSDTPAHDDDDPAELVERGFEPPRGPAPGRAYFTLASGRHFEAKVQVLPQQ